MSIARKILMGSSGGKKSTYVDDVFSTYLYTGQSTTKTITNGIDNLGEGGMLWVKNRDNARGHQLYDTERLASGSNTTSDYSLTSNSSGAARDMSPNGIVTWKNDGWSVLGGDGDINQNGFGDYASWNFRKQKGFFDVVTYTGTGSARTIPHNLGSVPGFIIVKQTSTAANWTIYHRDNGNSKAMYFTTAGLYNDPAWWNSTDPTASVFSLGNSDNTNKNGETYVAYVFAGGASTAATARSVDFDGSADYMVSTDSSYQPGTGDFTIECWVKHDALAMKGIFQLSGSSVFNGTNGIAVLFNTNSGNKRWELYAGGATTQESVSYSGYTTGVWAHLAVVKTGGKTKLYVDGIESISVTDTTNYSTESYLGLGGAFGTQYTFNGQISNFKYTKGQALYTSSFQPPTEPLTSTSQGSTASNVKVLCCQSSSATSATVIASALSITGSVTALTDSPFDDLEGFKFGEEDDKNIIKCGSYTGNGNSNGPEINLGWEPQWLLVKNTTLSTEQWFIFDSMRGIISNGTDYVLEPSRNVQEAGWDLIDLTPTGFKIKINDDKVNHESNYVYMALRRPDGYVGKPAEAGTDVFNMVMGTSNSDVPAYVSGFPVDFAFNRVPVNSENWWTQFRLTGDKYVIANSTAAEASSTPNKWDYNNGWYAATNNQSAYQSWMWKRHAGFDVVTYTGNGVAGHSIPHNLSKTPEMMWVKRRNQSGDWFVYHKGLDGGTNPATHYLTVNNDDEEGDYNAIWNDTAPTSTDFTVGTYAQVNSNNDDFIAILFASVDGISKVGSYTGANSQQTITTGFQPRFVIIKSTSVNRNWVTLDTVRGWAAGNDQELNLNKSDAQGNSYDFGAPTATGFTINYIGNDDTNTSGHTYIYYAHA